MTDPHLDDEALAAALDAPDAGAGAHLAGCAGCRARRDQLEAVRRAVAGPAPRPAPPELADRAVAAALAAFADERARAAGRAPGRAPALDRPVVPLRRPGRQRQGSAGRRVPSWALGAAAALAALLVAVPLLDRGTGGDGGRSVASGPADPADRTAAAGAAGFAGVVDGGDLGERSDPVALGRALVEAVGDEQAATASPAPSPGGGAAAAERSEPDAAAPLGSAASPAVTAHPADPACEQAVREQYGAGLGSLRYRATLRWEGVPALLLAFRLAEPSAGGPAHRAFVMTLDGCRLLVVQGF